jgi:hypothetical protein
LDLTALESGRSPGFLGHFAHFHIILPIHQQNMPLILPINKQFLITAVNA